MLHASYTFLNRLSSYLVLTLAMLVMAQQPALAQSKVIWTDNKANTIERANVDGSNRETLVSGVTTALGIAIDPVARKMYWVDIGKFVVGASDEVIRRANLDGTGVQTLLTTADGLRHPTDIQVDPVGKKFYWVDATTERIYRADLDGRKSEVLVDIPPFRAPDYNVGVGADRNLEFTTVWGLALDLGRHELYWTDYFAGDIHRTSMDGATSGAQITQLVRGLTTPRGITVDATDGRLYWVTGEFGSEVMRAFDDGSGVEVLVGKKLGTLLKQPFQIELDTGAGQMYWTDRDTGLIQRASFDGSGVSTLLTLTAPKKPGVVRPLSPTGLALHLLGDTRPPHTGSMPDLTVTLDKLRDKFKNGVDQIEFQFTVANSGSAAMTGAYTVKAVLSLDGIADAQDTLLGVWSGQQLIAGGAESFKSRLSLVGSHAGQFVIIVADPGNAVSETDETNNTATGLVTP